MPSKVMDLESLRISKGHTNRTEYARQVGTSREQIWRWETGRQSMSAAWCKRIADVLGVDMETVLRAVEA